MSSIAAVSAAGLAHAAPPAKPKGKSDGDGDHGVEPAAAQSAPPGGAAGSSGAVNKTA